MPLCPDEVRMKKYYGVLLLLFFCSPCVVQAATWRDQPWVTQESTHFVLHGPVTLVDHFAPVAAHAEEAYAFLTQELAWQPRAAIHLLVVDDTDGVDGWAKVLPFGMALINLSPPDDLSFLDHSDDWLRALIWHELTHVVQMDQAAGFPGAVQRVLGRQPLTFPHMFQPLWLLEGLAIQSESWSEARSGRQWSTLYQMRMRAQVEAGLASLSQVSAPSHQWPLDRAYLYGAWFYLFLEEQEGEEALEAWLQSYRRHLPGFVRRASAQAWEQNFDQLWPQYQAWLAHRFAPFNYAAPQGQPLTQTGLFDARPVVRSDQIYRLRYDGHTAWQLESYSIEGEVTNLGPVDFAGPIDVNAAGDLVMAAMMTRVDGRRYGDLWLKRDGEAWQRLTQDARYRDVRWSADGRFLIAKRWSAGRAQLDLLDAQGRYQRTLWLGEEDEVLGGYAVHPAGDQLVASLRLGRESWNLYQLDLGTGQWSPLLTGAAVYSDPVYDPEGERLLFSAEEEGGYNLYQLTLATQELVRLTQMNTGAFTPVYTAQGLAFQRYSARGYDLHYLAASQWLNEPARPLEASWRQAMAAAEPVSLTPARPYRPWATLRPHAWMPVVESNSDRTQYGVEISGQDASLRHQYTLRLAYDDLAEDVLGDLTYEWDTRYRLHLEREFAESRIDGDLMALRDELSVGLARLALWTADHDRLRLHAGAYFERERTAWRHSEQASLLETERSDLGLALSWQRQRFGLYNLGGPASGWSLLGIAEHHAWGDYEGGRVHLDGRYSWHLGRSHVAGARLYAAYAEAEAKAFELGGEKNEMAASFVGRDRYPLRGYGSDSLRVHEFAAVTLDYRLPLARINRSWGVHPLAAQGLYATLFADYAHLKGGEGYPGVGLEMTLETHLLYSMDLPISIGYAYGTEEELGGSEFWLRIGAQF